MSRSALVAWLTPSRRLGVPLLCMTVPITLWLLQGALALQQGSLSSKLSGDFSAFYMGGRFALEGRLDTLYDFAAQEQFQRAWSEQKEAGFLAFISPPFAVIFFAPLAWLPPYLALLLWRLAGLLALWGSLKMLQDELPGLTRHSSARLLLLAFLFFPTLQWFILGQATSLVLFLYVGFYVCLRRGQDLKAGLFLGLLLFKPQLGLWPALLLLYHRRGWALLGGLLTSALWILIGLLLSPAAMRGFLLLLPELTGYIRGETFHTWGLFSLYGFGAVLLDGASRLLGGAVGWILTASGGVMLLSFWRREPWSPASPAWDAKMAASLVLMPLLSPHLFAYDFMLLLLPAAILWGTAPARWEQPRFLWCVCLLWLSSFLGLYLSALSLYYLKAGIQWPVIFAVWWAALLSRGEEAASPART